MHLGVESQQAGQTTEEDSKLVQKAGDAGQGSYRSFLPGSVRKLSMAAFC
jgi:hypothetical protein